MLSVIIFEDAGYPQLLPLVYWRTLPELRVGYGRLWDRWVRHFPDQPLSLYCRPDYAAIAAARLQAPVNTLPQGERFLLINARLVGEAPQPLPNAPAVQWLNDVPVAMLLHSEQMERLTPELMLDRGLLKQVIGGLPSHDFFANPRMIHHPWDLIYTNEQALREDWEAAVVGVGQPPLADQGVHLLNPAQIHVAPSSRVYPGCVLDAESGPIYIDEEVTISPHTVIQGPAYIGPESLIQPAAILRSSVSIGRRCKIGGEVEGSIIHGFSNKQHNGFLGHAYVAEWVNLGADTVSSDLKNTYGHVRVPINRRDVDSGRMFVGPTLGDFCKTGIGQLLPTGMVMGFASMVANGGFCPKFVASFSWVTPDGTTEHDPDRALTVARKMMARRSIPLTDAEETLFKHLSGISERYETHAWHSDR